MDFEQLRLKTVQLLADKTVGLGLVDNEGQEDDVGQSGEDLAKLLSKTLSQIHEKEIPLAEQQESPEVAAMHSNIQRMRILQERVAACNQTLAELREAYTGVTARTSSLHEACDRALAFQTALAAGSEQIKTNLHFFQQADIIMRKLGNTSKLSVTGQVFTGILSSIDECLMFLKRHPEYKESSLYITKYEQCLSRAMTCIRVGVLADIQASVSDVRDRQAQLQVDYAKLGRGHADDDTFALLYGVFASRANSVRSALAVAEQRFAEVAEFQEMLSECQHNYFQARQQLLWPIIDATLANILNTPGESTCALTRTACAFILRVCTDEFRLYRQFFVTDSNPRTPGRITSPTPSIISRIQPIPTLHPFEDYIESMCRLLYDILRPIIVHNPHLETLTELCTTIRVEMIEERCSVPILPSGEEGLSFDPRSGFVRVMDQLVGDIAERIVFRVAAYGNSDIAGYKPAPGDLAYPQKLEMMRNIESGNNNDNTTTETTISPEAEKAESNENSEIIEASSANGVSLSSTKTTTSPNSTSISAVDLHCLWYPTVRRTVMCLTKLFKCLDMGVFQSLARELLTMTCDSLEYAANEIATTSVSKSPIAWRPLDSQLFVVKHLLILREQTTPYRQAAAHRSDATLPTRDFSIDFTKMKNSLLEGSRWFEFSTNNAFLEILFSMPIHVNEQTGDSRQVLDSKLRIWCNQLISTTASIVCGPLMQFVDVAEDELLKQNFDLKMYPGLAPLILNEKSNAAFKALSLEWREVKSKFALYIGVNDTESILLAPVKKRITDTFSRAIAFASRAYDEEGLQIAALPTIQQVYLALNKD